MQLMSMIKVATLAMATLAATHPGAHEAGSMSHAEKRSFLLNAKRSLGQCADRLERRGLTARIEARRAEQFDFYRRQILETRAYNPSVNESHYSSLHVTETTSAEDLFAKDPVCILSPEGEIGPFWVKGELVRSDIRDGEAGIPIIMDGQFIDIETCEPIVDLYWDVWSCNSTGVYSGVQDSSNGNGDDASNLDNLALRGIQKTDTEGVAQFKSVFPGHYGGRTTHVHVVAHVGAQTLPNNTITGGQVAHIGQLFFDQDLITEVEATYPYSTNEVEITLNADDHVVQDETEDSASDPFFEYALLGESLEDGIFAWITLGVNVSASYDTSYAALLTANGGVANSQSGGAGGGFGGGEGGAGGPPSS